jgi:hypothetical protein
MDLRRFPWFFAPLIGIMTLSSSGAGQELVIRDRSDVLVGQALREPSLAQHPDGTLFAAGYSRDPAEANDPPNLFRSTDGGATWTQVDVGTVAEGALGNSDVDLKIGPDGSLYFLTMGFDRSVGEGIHVALGVSRDVGGTWSWRYISRTRFDDRPWVGVTPDARITGSGGSSHLAIGPSGEIAVRVAPGSASGIRVDPEADHIAISLDDGRSWALKPAPGERTWDEVPRWVEPIAWDTRGRLFSLWSEGSQLRLGWSQDHGSLDRAGNWPLRGSPAKARPCERTSASSTPIHRIPDFA